MMKIIAVFFLLLLVSFSSFGQGNFYDNKMALESTYSFSPINNGTGSAGVAVHFKKNVEVGISFLGTPGATGAGVSLGFHAKNDSRRFYPSVFVSLYSVSVQGGGDQISYSGSGFLNYRILNAEKIKSELFAGFGFASGITTEEDNNRGNFQNSSSTAFSIGLQVGVEIKRLTLRIGIGKSFSQSKNTLNFMSGSVGIGILL